MANGGSALARPVKGGGLRTPIELSDITLFKSETEERRVLKKLIYCFFLLVLFEGEIK